MFKATIVSFEIDKDSKKNPQYFDLRTLKHVIGLKKNLNFEKVANIRHVKSISGQLHGQKQRKL